MTRIPGKDQIDLLKFRDNIATCLINVGLSANGPKRGRPSSSKNENYLPTKRCNTEIRPLKEIRLDLLDHMPEFDTKKEASRCKTPNCTGKTHVYCEKCKVHLCFVRGKNCFKDYQTN